MAPNPVGDEVEEIRQEQCGRANELEESADTAGSANENNRTDKEEGGNWKPKARDCQAFHWAISCNQVANDAQRRQGDGDQQKPFSRRSNHMMSLMGQPESD